MRSFTEEYELLEKKYGPLFARVLNAGSVTMESHWGNEATIVNTARMSTMSAENRNVRMPGDFSVVESTGTFCEKDFRLLRELLFNDHGTPFETVFFRFRVIAPIFVMRQWMRHRISSYNEFSQRYRKAPRDYYIPVFILEETQQQYMDAIENCFSTYDKLYSEVVKRCPSSSVEHKDARARAREMYRCLLPVACYTDVYWTVNFRSLLNFLKLRCSEHAQFEIRAYADSIKSMLGKTHPILSALVDEYLLYSTDKDKNK